MRFTSLVALTALSALTAAAWSSPNYKISALALAPGVEPLALNDAGDLLFYDFVGMNSSVTVAVPTLQVKGRAHPFGPAVNDAGTIYMDGMFPETGLNNLGQSAGYGRHIGSAVRDRNGREHSLAYPFADGSARIVDINDHGHVLGAIEDNFAEVFEIALWSRRRVRRINFGEMVHVIAMNNSDQVLIRKDASGTPALWDPHLGTDDIAWPDDSYQVLTADAMSDDGVITGRARRGTRNFAYVLDDSGFRLIAPPTGGIKMEPKYVNDARDVIGLTTFDPGGGYEYFFAPAGAATAVKLKPLVQGIEVWGSNIHIAGINNLGQILGHGGIDGLPRSFVMNRIAQVTPVPEPSMLVACAVVFVTSRRQRATRSRV